MKIKIKDGKSTASHSTAFCVRCKEYSRKAVDFKRILNEEPFLFVPQMDADKHANTLIMKR